MKRYSIFYAGEKQTELYASNVKDACAEFSRLAGHSISEFDHSKVTATPCKVKENSK